MRDGASRPERATQPPDKRHHGVTKRGIRSIATDISKVKSISDAVFLDIDTAFDNCV